MYMIIFLFDLKHFIIPDTLNFGIMILALAKNFLPDLNLSFTQIITQINYWRNYWLSINLDYYLSL